MDPMQRVNQLGSGIAGEASGVTPFAQLLEMLKNLVPAMPGAQDPNAGLVASPGMMSGQPGAQPVTRGQLQQQMTQPRK